MALSGISFGNLLNLPFTNKTKTTGTTSPMETKTTDAATDKVELSSASEAKLTGVKKDKDGNSYINVQPWGTGKDDCLSRIVQEHYGVAPYSKEGKAIMESVMNSNPQIYDSGRKAIVDGKVVDGEKNFTETIIYDNEKMILPDADKTSGTDNSAGKRDNDDNGTKYNPAPGEADNETGTDKGTDKGKTDNDNNGNKYNPAPGEADNAFPKFPTWPTFKI